MRPTRQQKQLSGARHKREDDNLQFLRRRWQARETEDLQDTQLQPKTFTDRVLAAQGLLEEVQEAQGSHDPYLMQDMAEAVRCIQAVVADEGRIMIHGDYDCDGLTATALMARALKEVLGPEQLLFHIPNRITEGYGLGEEAIERCLDEGVDLLLTVDCGIRSVEETARLRAAGVQVVITDHHEPGETLPEAEAVLNPHRADCAYPCVDLAGAGVAWKLTQALEAAGVVRLTVPLRQEIMALAALGTVADQMLLRGENRWLVQAGLEALRLGAATGIQQLLRALKLDPQHLTSTDLSFNVAPKINAAGRLGEEHTALDLLLGTHVRCGTLEVETNGSFNYAALVDELLALNEERRRLEREAMSEARLQLSAEPELARQPVIVVVGDDWHVGVLGIIAARLTRIYHKPALVLTRDEPDGQESLRSPEVLLKGSGRSVDTVDLLSLLEAASGVLESFGGHSQAAGLSLRGNQLDALRAQLTAAWEAAHGPLTDDGAGVELVHRYTLTLEPVEWTAANALALEQLNPYGNGFEEPLFHSRGVRVLECKQLGKDKHHLRLVFANGNGGKVTSIAFGLGELAALIQPGDEVDILYYLRMNRWRGKASVQLEIQDLQLPAVQEYPLAEDSLPTRACLKAVWPALSTLMGEHECQADLPVLTKHLGSLLTCKISVKEVLLSIKIFAESGLLSLTEVSPERILLRQTPQNTRVSLDASQTFQQIRAEGGSDL